MDTVETLKRQVRELMKDLAINGVELGRLRGMNMWVRQGELLLARTEILKSIAHRQGLIIEALQNQIEYGKAA